MPATRTRQNGDKTVILIPFPEANSAEHISSSINGWNNNGKFGAGDVVCADSRTLHGKLGGLSGPRDVLYIRGHGGPGDPTLESSDHNETISVTELVSLLDGKLSKGFSGIIKIYACDSAADWTILYLFTWQSFAKRFADAMWAAGYRACSFYGYTVKVTSSGHNLGNHRLAGLKDGSLKRASEMRVQVHPKR